MKKTTLFVVGSAFVILAFLVAVFMNKVLPVATKERILASDPTPLLIILVFGVFLVLSQGDWRGRM